MVTQIATREAINHNCPPTGRSQAGAMASLKDQLLQAGLVDKKKAKQLQQEQRKEARSRQKGQAHIDETREQVRRDQLEKAERDRLLNRAQQEEAGKKAIKAQVIQLITLNRVPRERGDVAYQFADGTRIKKLYVTQQIHKDLINGRLAIARLGGDYELLPAPAAQKIAQRDPQVIVVLNQYEPPAAAEDDPYAQYQIPDDLMW
jgi:uncharacterized protein YaiL (DUF2058 family)